MNHHIHPDISSTEDFKELKISSPAFGEGEYIPVKYTCEGSNINPPLVIEGIPADTKCLAIIAEDPDAHAGTWVHWVIWNIPVTRHYKENTVHGSEGVNDFQKKGYSGPCPPPGQTHRYHFKVYALVELLLLPPEAGKKQLERVMSDAIAGFGILTGKYRRKGTVI